MVYVAIYPMKTQKEFNTAIHLLCKEVGVPHTMVMDGHSSAQVNLETKQFCHQVGTIMRKFETGTPWSKQAEIYIGFLQGSVTTDQRIADSSTLL